MLLRATRLPRQSSGRAFANNCQMAPGGIAADKGMRIARITKPQSVDLIQCLILCRMARDKDIGASLHHAISANLSSIGGGRIRVGGVPRALRSRYSAPQLRGSLRIRRREMRASLFQSRPGIEDGARHPQIGGWGVMPRPPIPLAGYFFTTFLIIPPGVTVSARYKSPVPASRVMLCGRASSPAITSMTRPSFTTLIVSASVSPM